jgi:hypothetical protein
MAAHHALRRPAVLAALALLAGGLIPMSPVAAASGTDPSLQVSPELQAPVGETARLNAKLSSQASGDKTVNFEVMDGPGDKDGDTPASPDYSCNIANGSSTCSLDITSKTPGLSHVRSWIAGPNPDMAEARLANDKSEVILIGGILDPSPDCKADDGSSCHDGSPTNEGDAAVGEPDATDVVQVQWLNFADGHINCDDTDPSNGADVEYNAAGQGETYTCTVTTLGGVPIKGAFIDGEIVDGTNKNLDSSGADYKDLCQTDEHGQCSTGNKVTMTGVGANKICFWAEPQKAGDPSKGEDDKYESGGTATNGRECNNETVDEPENNDLADSVYLDDGPPRAEGLDVQPETITVAGASRFSLRGVVFDQFGAPFKGNTTLQAKLFAGSALAPNGDNTVTAVDPSLKCQTGGSDGCTIFTGSQNELGQNLACVWIEGKAPTAMVGQADQDSATCTAPKAPWQSTADQEARADATGDDGRPFPPTDGLDVVRFAVQSNPKISSVTPTDRRQDLSGDVLGIDGINFLPSALITVSGTGVTLGPTAVVSDKRLEASLAVAADAPPGPRDVTVTNRSDGGTVTCTGCFRVIGQGYWMVASDGGIFAFGDAKFAGSAGSQALNKPIVAMAPTPSGQGYWLVSSDGGLFNYGDAPFVGSAGGLNLSKPIVSMAPTPSGRGYWLVASDGGVFNYGDARFYGATSRLTLAKPIVSIVATPSGRGYWLVASDGGIFSFGDAKFFGSTGNIVLNKPIIAMAPTKTGKGYWMVATDGGIFAFGDATFYGSTGDIPLNKPIVGMTTTILGKGYWLVASDGGVFSFGDARFFGSTGSIKLNQPIVSIARR